MSILEVSNLKKQFYDGKNNRFVHAVDDISFRVGKGDFVGLVGESGCGKSTTAKLVAGLLKADTGRILVDGQDISKLKSMRRIYSKLQMVFQNPTESFDPRFTLGSSIVETQMNFGANREGATENMYMLLKRAGLKQEYAGRYPYQVSGGECQRAAIARALSVSPKLLICDEATSALDVSVQAQIVELLLILRQEMEISYLFISHDLALVQSVCSSVLVMYKGKIVEYGDVDMIIGSPSHPYTQLLLSSVFPIDPDTGWTIPRVPHQNVEVKNGCVFCDRCYKYANICSKKIPALAGKTAGHHVACHFPD